MRDAPVAILHLCDCLNPGGTERQLIEQCRLIDRRRWRPLVGVFHAGGTLAHELGALDVPVLEFPLHTRLAHPNTALQIVRLAALCRRERVRIVHAHDFYANLLGLPLRRLAPARLVTSRRDLAHWLSPMKRRALELACRGADRVVANARSIGRTVIDELGVSEARVRLVPNGIDLARFDEEARRAPDPPLPDVGGVPSVAVVGNMNLPEKGQSDVLAAAELLRTRGLRLRLVFIGDGRERRRLEAEARTRGLDGDTLFLGRRLDVPSLLARTELACSASWAEGSPNAIIEALAAARPVVATVVGGCPELIADGQSGLLVPPRDPPRLAEALGRLLADPSAARRMGERGRLTVEERHSLAGSAAILDGLYRELLCAP